MIAVDRRRPMVAIVLTIGWLILTKAVVSNWLQFPESGWPRVGAVWAYEAVTVVPIIMIWRHGLKLFRGSAQQYTAAGLALLGACTYLGLFAALGWRPLVERLAVNSAVAAAEEYVFRGYLWEKMTAFTRRTGVVVALNVACFTLVHIPREPTELVLIAGLGLVLSLLRHYSRNLVVPAAAHLVMNVLP